MMQADHTFQEQRCEERIAGRFRLFVHIQHCQSMPNLVGKSIACEACDISKHGIQIESDVEVPIGTRLNIAVAIGQPFAMYLLEGQIRWQHNVDSINRIGIQLLDMTETDYQEWVVDFDSTVAWVEYLEASII